MDGKRKEKQGVVKETGKKEGRIKILRAGERGGMWTG